MWGLLREPLHHSWRNMIPYQDAAVAHPSKCDVMVQVATKDFGRRYTHIKCHPAGWSYARGDLFLITADFTSRSGKHYKFGGIFDNGMFTSYYWLEPDK